MRNTINKAIRAIPIWSVYFVLSLPIFWWFYLAATNQFGADPLDHLINEYGEMALKLLIIVLAITPLLRLFKINALRLRRAIAVMGFFYAFAHMAVWLILDQRLDFGSIWTEIVKRPFITVGMISFLIMVPLAITSNNYSVRKLRAKWGKLHKLTYPLAILVVIHFIMVVKGFPVEPFIYLAIVLALLGARYYWKRKAEAKRNAVAQAG